MKTTTLPPSVSLTISRIIFYCCSLFFLLMGAGLVFFPGPLINNINGSAVEPAIYGILRGAGGSIMPYSVLYLLVAANPSKRKWALMIIALANIIAVILDISSVITGEYLFVHAMIDLPMELLSLLAITVVLFKIRSSEKAGIETDNPPNKDL